MTPSTALDRLGSVLKGALVRPGHDRYDDLRIVWNATADRRPAAIVRAVSVEDVVAVVAAARELDCGLAVRGGGHSIPGYSTCDDGIVLDLRDMNRVTVDPAAQTVTVEGGALIADLDRATQEHGLAVPMGTVAHTGVAGLTLGGGLGRLTRMHGMSVDALTGLQVVTADGRIIEASDDGDADLFWAMRGAGANFGVATRLDFRAFPIGTDAAAALAVYDLDLAQDVLIALGEFERVAPEDFIAVGGLRTLPSGPPFPPELHGRRVLTVAANSFADPDRGEKDTRAVTQFAPTAFAFQARMPYLGMQQMSDDLYRWGQRNYVKGGLLGAMTAGAAEAALAAFDSVPGEHAEIDFIMLGGASSRVPEDAMAYSGRAATFYNGVQAIWQNDTDDEAQMGWCRQTFHALAPFQLDTNYVNALEDEDESGLVRAYGPEKYARLLELKRRYDPGNLFHLNHNIRP